MSASLLNDPGYLGCNFCGKIKQFNANKHRIIWKLCNKCTDIYNASKIPKRLKPQIVNTPTAIYRTNENFFWPTFEMDYFCWPIYDVRRNSTWVAPIEKIRPMYCLFDPPEEDREMKSYPSMTDPTINRFLPEYRDEIFDD